MTASAKQAQLTKRDDYTHWTTVPIRYSDTDKLGHVNNTSIAAFIEAGRCDLIYALARSAGEVKLDFILAHMSIDFIKEIHFPGNVDVGSRLLSVGNKSLATVYGVFVHQDCCATARCVNVFFDRDLRVTCTPPADLRAALLNAIA